LNGCHSKFFNILSSFYSWVACSIEPSSRPYKALCSFDIFGAKSSELVKTHPTISVSDGEFLLKIKSFILCIDNKARLSEKSSTVLDSLGLTCSCGTVCCGNLSFTIVLAVEQEAVFRQLCEHEHLRTADILVAIFELLVSDAHFHPIFPVVAEHVFPGFAAIFDQLAHNVLLVLGTHYQVVHQDSL